MGLANVLLPGFGRPSAKGTALLPDVAVLEDQEHAALLAIEACDGLGLTAATFSSPATFLSHFTNMEPRIVVLDWRLEQNVGAGVFMALRHRFGLLPIVCWTAMPPSSLPDIVTSDGRTMVVQKTSGIDALESALRWASDLASVTSREPREANA